MTPDRPFAPGWHAPHLTGLTQGQAVARCCDDCVYVSLPPLRTCPKGHTDGTWVTLENIATVLHHTTGSDGDFALVRFPGCDTLTLARLALPPGAPCGVLRATECVPPLLILHPKDDP